MRIWATSANVGLRVFWPGGLFLSASMTAGRTVLGRCQILHFSVPHLSVALLAIGKETRKWLTRKCGKIQPHRRRRASVGFCIATCFCTISCIVTDRGHLAV